MVLVGDSGVGKTRLVCARAYLQPVALAQLVKTHVPTIWAIDQYRIYKDVSSRTLDSLVLHRGATQEFELRSIKFKKYISGLRSIFWFQKKHNFA